MAKRMLPSRIRRKKVCIPHLMLRCLSRMRTEGWLGTLDCVGISRSLFPSYLFEIVMDVSLPTIQDALDSNRRKE